MSLPVHQCQIKGQNFYFREKKSLGKKHSPFPNFFQLLAAWHTERVGMFSEKVCGLFSPKAMKSS